MKVIIPLAGFGKRLRPHTYSQPKPLINVAGKAVLGHILNELALLEVEEIVFIVSDRSTAVAEYMQTFYPHYRTRFVEQTTMLGQSHAIYLTRDAVGGGEILIIFSDTIFKTNLASLATVQADGALHLREVADPARFGVAIVNEAGFVTRLVEKPTEPVSNLAVVGVYYFKEASRLFQAIEKQIALDLRLAGEFFLADAITLLLEEGTRFQARNLELWEDCGTIPALLETNRRLLTLTENAASQLPDPQGGYLLIPPCYIAPDAKIERSVIGPYASIGPGVQISDSIVRDTIIQEKARLEASLITGSVIGRNATITNGFQRLNVGDDSQLEAEGPANPKNLTGDRRI